MLLSGSDELGSAWGPQGLSPGTRSRFTAGLGTLIVLQAIRPSYGRLFGSRLLDVYDAYRRHNQTSASPNRPRGRRGRRPWLGDHASAMMWAFSRP